MSWVSDGGGGKMCLVRVSSEISSFARKVGNGRVSSVLRGLTMGLVLLAMLNSVWKAWCKLGCALPQTQSICCSLNTNPFSQQRRRMSVHCFWMFRSTGTSC